LTSDTQNDTWDTNILIAKRTLATAEVLISKIKKGKGTVCGAFAAANDLEVKGGKMVNIGLNREKLRIIISKIGVFTYC